MHVIILRWLWKNDWTILFHDTYRRRLRTPVPQDASSSTLHVRARCKPPMSGRWADRWPRGQPLRNLVSCPALCDKDLLFVIRGRRHRERLAGARNFASVWEDCVGCVFTNKSPSKCILFKKEDINVSKDQGLIEPVLLNF